MSYKTVENNVLDGKQKTLFKCSLKLDKLK